MDSLAFTPDLALGIPVMDQSHRIVFARLEELQNLPPRALDQACARLAIELAADLREEERLMAAINYPAAEVHQSTHRSLLAQIDLARARLAEGDELAARKILGSLESWIAAHINTMDLALAIALSRFE